MFSSVLYFATLVALLKKFYKKYRKTDDTVKDQKLADDLLVFLAASRLAEVITH